MVATTSGKAVEVAVAPDGADGSATAPHCEGLVMLMGPVAHWWGPEQGSDAHRAYIGWREELNDALVRAHYLVYRPHRAWQGAWDNRGQQANDAAMDICHALVVLTPPGVPSVGTDAEMARALSQGRELVACPPLPDVEAGIVDALARIAAAVARYTRPS